MLDENDPGTQDVAAPNGESDPATDPAAEAASDTESPAAEPAAAQAGAEATATVTTTTTTTRRRAAGRPAGPPATAVFSAPAEEPDEEDESPAAETAEAAAPTRPPVGATFQAPPTELAPARAPQPVEDDEDDAEPTADGDAEAADNGEPKRRRRRGGRRRRKGDGEDAADGADGAETSGADSKGADAKGAETDDAEGDDDAAGGSTRRRRRRARAGEGAGASPDDPENTVVKVREGRTAEDEITGVSGSTRLEAKKQRRREGREAGRRRAPIVSEAEFLARRESVNREMVVRQQSDESGDYTQIAVLEDDVLVEHYVARESQTSLIGNVYLGKVQNVLPSMEAAFVDIGAGRNAVIYAGEVDWSNIQNGKQRKIEDALQPGQTILVQVSKDPIGQKGARLTSQVSIPGRFLVYVPGGGSNGISRKLPENERARLKALLKEALPESAGVIVRTAAEGATEDQLQRDISALTARWQDIESKVADGKAPQLLYAEPDLMIKVIRDLFNEDFSTLTVQGDEAWDMVSGYVAHVAPDLKERVRRHEGDPSTGSEPGSDVFAERRIDEQIHKALDRKVHLPSGGSLVIDRTEAMVVVDVNTGRFTGSGGNLEETVTKNNLEAAEEIVRQLRLRDLGGIIVIDFIDMVLESNRDLVLRRLVECLGRDRTRHQVAEVTSLGLVQMTRKRIGTGLLESFSHECEACQGRGVVVADAPIEPKKDDGPRRGRRGGRTGRSGQNSGNQGSGNQGSGNQGSGQKSGRQRGGKQAAAAADEAPAQQTDDAPTQESPVQEPPAPESPAPEVSAPQDDATPAPVEAEAAPPVLTDDGAPE